MPKNISRDTFDYFFSLLDYSCVFPLFDGGSTLGWTEFALMIILGRSWDDFEYLDLKVGLLMGL